MKRVLMVTKIGKNYGAVLQAYALQTVLKKLGASPRILDYRLRITMNTYRVLPKVTGFTTLRHFLRMIPTYPAKWRSVQAFKRFKRECLLLTSPYSGYEALKKNPPEADIYLTGSDQVWNPKICFDPAYYLLFGDPKTVRASYAASVGISVMPEEYREEFARRVAQVPIRSVREEDGQRLLKGMGIDSVVHIDPTLLLSVKDYERIAAKRLVKGKYILVYLLILPENYREYIAALRARYPGYEVIDISGYDEVTDLGDRRMMDIGPREFVALIRDAAFVLTSSFHGTVFSVIHGREFAAVLPQGTGARIVGLLTKLGIGKQIIQTPAQLETQDFAYDHEQVQKRIQDEKESALAYLRDILQDEKETDG